MQKFQDKVVHLQGLTNKQNKVYGQPCKGRNWEMTEHGNFNRDSGFTLSQDWYPVANMLTNQQASQSKVSIWLWTPALTGLQL
jgi:hypothetical protein